VPEKNIPSQQLLKVFEYLIALVEVAEQRYASDSNESTLSEFYNGCEVEKTRMILLSDCHTRRLASAEIAR